MTPHERAEEIMATVKRVLGTEAAYAPKVTLTAAIAAIVAAAENDALEEAAAAVEKLDGPGELGHAAIALTIRGFKRAADGTAPG